METYKTITSTDGKNRIEFDRDTDSLHRYVTYDDRYRANLDFPDPPHWTIVQFSGLYDTAEAMEADARASFDWLREGV